MITTRQSKRVLFLIFILTIVSQVEGGEPIPQIWEIADDISVIESLLHSTRLIQTVVDDDVEVKKTVKNMFTLDLDGLEQRNLTGFQQDLMEITRVFDEQCPSVEGCKVGGDLENGMELMRKLEEYTTLEQRIPNLMLMKKIGNIAWLGDVRSFQSIQKIGEYPKFNERKDYDFITSVTFAASDAIVLIRESQEITSLVAELNVTRAKEELDFLLQVQNETLNLATEQVLVDGFASSIETLKLRTEKLKEMEGKVEKVIRQLEWLVGVEDGVKDPLNNRSFVPNIRITDIERVTDVMAGKRLVTLTKLDEKMIGNQLKPLRTAKKRLEKWLSVRRALRESGGAAVESDTIRSILGNVKSRLKQLPTVKSVRECMDKFNLTNLNLTLETPTSIDERRRRIVDELVTPFAQIGFSEDDVSTVRKFVANQSITPTDVFNRWKQLSNVSVLIEKVKKLDEISYFPLSSEDEAELVASWLNNTGISSGVSCLQMDRKMDLINGSTEVPPLYSNNSDLTNIIGMNRNLTQLETMWRDEKEEQLNASNGRRVVQDIGNLTETFSQLSSAFRTSALAIKYDTDYQLVVDNIEVINQTMEGLPVEVKNRALWSNEVLNCLKDVKKHSVTLKTSHSKLATYQTLDDLVTILDGFQGDFRCDSSDVFRRILPYTNDSLQPAVLKLSDLSLSYAGVESVAQVIRDVSTIFNDIQQQYATTTVPTNAESFKQVQDQSSMDNESEDGDDESAVSSIVWIIIVLVVVLVIAGLSVAVYFRFFHKKTKRESAEVEKKTENVDKTAGTTAGSGEKIQKDSATGNVAVLP